VGCKIELVVLGVGQDAGIPQIGNVKDPAWSGSERRYAATSLALIDKRENRRYLFEATPDIRGQLQQLDMHYPEGKGPLGISGVFLTHAHIGHYAGLMFFGHESAGTNNLDVYAMPRMADYLTNNGPWSQLVDFDNITLQSLEDSTPVDLGTGLTVTPMTVPHRDEFSETVGFRIQTPGKNIFFVPDIDDWQKWQSEFGRDINAVLADVDLAFIDATFFDDNELPGRDMSKIPHPRVSESLEIFSDLVKSGATDIHFIHYNHTNPIRFARSEQSRRVDAAGFSIARDGDVHCLVKG